MQLMIIVAVALGWATWLLLKFHRVGLRVLHRRLRWQLGRYEPRVIALSDGRLELERAHTPAAAGQALGPGGSRCGGPRERVGPEVLAAPELLRGYCSGP